MAGLYQDSCVDKPAGGHGMDAENKTTSCVDKPADGHGPKGSSGNFRVPVPGETLTVAAVGNKEMFLRPCVDCGLITGSFCDECVASDRLPNEVWAEGQMTPLCTRCDRQHDECHFCRGELWVRPPAHR